MSFMSETIWIIIAGAFVTYLSRIGGYLVIARIRTLPPRLSAALDAVPAAVLTTLVVPAAVSHGPAEALTILIAGLIALRLSLLPTFILGAGVIILLRQIGL
jgi:uncharacterized membrane protein